MPPHFDTEPSDTSVFLGQTAMFECSIGATPPATPKWLKDDQPFSLDHRMKVLPSGSLEINDVRLSDRADYKCKVSDREETKISRSASLKIDLGKMKIDFKFSDGVSSFYLFIFLPLMIQLENQVNELEFLSISTYSKNIE